MTTEATSIAASGYDVECPSCHASFTISAIPAWCPRGEDGCDEPSCEGGNFTECPECGASILIEEWEHTYD